MPPSAPAPLLRALAGAGLEALIPAVAEAAAKQQPIAALIADAAVVLSRPDKLPRPTRSLLADLLGLRTTPSVEVAALKSAFAAAGLPVENPPPRREIDAMLSALKETLRPVAGDRAAEVAPSRPPPPPAEGPRAEPARAPTISPDAPDDVVAARLLSDADGASARRTLQTLGALPDPADPVGRDFGPRVAFELPFLWGERTATIAFEVAPDGRHRRGERARRNWQVRFSLDVEPLGPVHASVRLGEVAAVTLWAESDATRNRLMAGIPDLRRSLSELDFAVDSIEVAGGRPPPRPERPEAHLLDRSS